MAEVIAGQVKTLAGHVSRPPTGMCCDNHPNNLATHRVQGETDVMGATFHDFCDFCYQRHLMQEPESEMEECEFCSMPSTSLKDYRDLREGLLGPIRRVCETCIREDQQSILDELPPEERPRVGLQALLEDEEETDDPDRVRFDNEDND